jgi:hypothetical protein
MGNATYQPAFVFQAQLGSTKAVWEATSHEVGHTVSCWHEGLPSHLVCRINGTGGGE